MKVNIEDLVDLDRGSSADTGSSATYLTVTQDITLKAIHHAGFTKGFCLGNAIYHLLKSQENGDERDEQADISKAKFYLVQYLNTREIR